MSQNKYEASGAYRYDAYKKACGLNLNSRE